MEQQTQTGVVIGRKGQNCLEIVDNNDVFIHMRHKNQVFIPTQSVNSEAEPQQHPKVPLTSCDVTDIVTNPVQAQTNPVNQEDAATDGNTLTNEATADASIVHSPPTNCSLRRSTRSRVIPRKYDDFILTGRK